jgi:hypothetical protein
MMKDFQLAVPHSDWKKYRVGDRLERMIVNSVHVERKFIDLILLGESEASSSPEDVRRQAKEVASRAVRWLAEPPEQREAHLSSLITLWATVVCMEPHELSFATALQLLGPPLAPEGRSTKLVEDLLKASPPKVLTREALTWLGAQRPKDAIRLWTALLTPTRTDEKVEAGDVKAVLQLCEAGGFEPPKVSGVVARGLSDDVLAVLAASKLPEARLDVVQALQERHSSDKPPALLKDLCSDSCEVVRAAAQNCWVALGGTTETQEKEEDESDVSFSRS